jgi:dipeptidyl aminopeptidase/acylaminoacyl peptidase
MTRLVPLVASLLALLTLATACGGSGESSPDGDGSTGGNGGNAPTGLQVVIFRDTINSVLVAQSVADGRKWQLPIDPSEFLTAIDCSPDGQRSASLVKNLQTGTEVRFSGAQPAPVRVAGDGFGLDWAPDGSRIAVTAYTPAASENRLELLDPNSGALTTATTSSGPIGAPRWSPDGTKIAFDASNYTSNALFVYTLDQPKAVQLLSQAPVFAPDWSPDGGSLLFSAPSGAASLSQIFIVGVDGSNPRELTTSDVSKGLPRWSPDGSMVAFAGTILIPLASSRPMKLHNLAVYTMQPNGTGEQALTDVALDAWLLGWCVSGPWLDEGWEEVAG